MRIQSRKTRHLWNLAGEEEWTGLGPEVAEWVPASSGGWSGDRGHQREILCFCTGTIGKMSRGETPAIGNFSF